MSLSPGAANVCSVHVAPHLSECRKQGHMLCRGSSQCFFPRAPNYFTHHGVSIYFLPLLECPSLLSNQHSLLSSPRRGRGVGPRFIKHLLCRRPWGENTEIKTHELICSRPLASLTLNTAMGHSATHFWILYNSQPPVFQRLSLPGLFVPAWWRLYLGDNRRTLLFYEAITQALCGNYSFRLSGLSL